ncbi:sensor histidine kinase [Actinomadura gamaensis]|uniref:histidine kinase n=1 Tax=Actinomadura gamaensis TaxID=1763541 RepID=A0ABV9UBU6_9ACTN
MSPTPSDQRADTSGRPGDAPRAPDGHASNARGSDERGSNGRGSDKRGPDGRGSGEGGPDGRGSGEGGPDGRGSGGRRGGAGAFSKRAGGSVLAWAGAVFFAGLLDLVLHRPTGQFSQTVVLPAVLMAVPGLMLRRRTPALVLLLALGWVVAVAEHVGWSTGYTKVLVDDVVLAYIALSRPRRTRTAACSIIFAVQLAAAVVLPHGPDSQVQAVAVVVLGFVAAMTTARSMRERREHAVELRTRETERALAAERLRIARELHDMVAHSIGIVAIQAGVGGRVIDTQPDEARNALAAIEATSRETLAGLRRMLVTLRESGTEAADGGPAPAPLDPAPGLADLDRLVAATRDADVRVEVRWEGERRPLPPEIDLSVFRIVQEALTNVVRHAHARACRVTIGFGEDELTVSIEDDGTGGTPGDGGGFGIVGMRERAALLRGELSAGPRPEGGFRVAARIPVPATAQIPVLR